MLYATLVKQQFPNIDFPTVSVRLSYPGGSPSEIRDAIVKPMEDAIAGAPDLDFLTSSIQQGQASITARFLLSSDKTTDLVEVERRVQSTRGVLPTDLNPPFIGSFDPSEANVVTLQAGSSSLSRAALSAIVTNDIVPKLEQVDGVANVNAGGTVTPKTIEVLVNPEKMASAGLTPPDVVNAISSNNVRVPGGIVYGAARETSVDVRGDVSDVPSVAGLLLERRGNRKPRADHIAIGRRSAAVRSALGSRRRTGERLERHFGLERCAEPVERVSPRLLRVGDVANVIDDFEPQRTYAYVGDRLAISLNVQKQSGASEVAVSQNVVRVLPQLRAQYPAVDIGVLNVQSDFSQAQIDAVFRTLALGIIVTGIVMLLFLGSWRNAIVVLVAIPCSLGITLGLMSIFGFTIDTVSLLAMTLIIGILVDDSIVVLENISRHYDDGESPQTAAILGRSEIGNAAIVITLVDVVVFLPIAFLPGIVGRFLSEFGLVVVAATLTSLAVSFTITPALAGNWSLRSSWRPPRLLRAFTRGFEAVRSPLSEPRCSCGRCAIRSSSCRRFARARSSHRWRWFPTGLVGFEFIPRVDRGEIFEQVDFPVGTPLSVTNEAISALTQQIAGMTAVERVTAVAGQYQASFGGSDGAPDRFRVRSTYSSRRKRTRNTRSRRARFLGTQARQAVIQRRDDHRDSLDGHGRRKCPADRLHHYVGRRQAGAVRAHQGVRGAPLHSPVRRTSIVRS